MVFHTILSPGAEHFRALPDIVFWEGFCVPRDGDDEEESPSPVEKGEGDRLAGKGSTADVRPIHRPYGRSPFPFREGQLWYSGIPGHGFQEADSGVHRLSGPDHPARGGPSGGDFDLKNGDVKK